ncbi:MAG: M48 family metallopeptidase [Phycisphaerales bacterium JB054]
MTEQLEIAGLTFAVRRSTRRKTLELTVDRAGELVAYAPAETPESELSAWISSKLLWVHQKLAQKKALIGTVHPPEFVSGESIFFLGRSYRLRVVDRARSPLQLDGEWFLLRASSRSKAANHFQQWYMEQGECWLKERSRELERLTGQSPSTVVVGDLGFRWGSCGRNGALYFNWRLLQLPVRLIDYVVVHEQIHLLHHNHSPAFWQALECVLPDWQERKDELQFDWGRYARFALAADGPASSASDLA